MNKHELKEAFKVAFPHTIPVLTGFLILGIAYGVLMNSKGYSVIYSVLMSAVAFCGSMQFVAITLLTTIFNPIEAFLLSMMVNARHLFYGIAMLDKYRGVGKIKNFLIFTLCDETFSLVSSITPPPTINKRTFYFAISCLDYIYWIVGTFLGGVLGTLITFNTTGLDFVLTALFVVLFIEQVRNKENRIYGFLGIALGVLSLTIFGANQMVIPTMILVLLILFVWRKISWS